MFDPKYYEETYSLADVGKLCKIGGFWPLDLDQVRTDWGGYCCPLSLGGSKTQEFAAKQ
jgi:hypothetical protein